MAAKIQLPAIKGVIGNWVYYQTVIPFREVAQRIDNDHSIREYKTLDDHLQRGLTARSKKIKDYLLRENTRFFNSAIIGLFGGKPNWYSFEFAPSAIPDMELDDNVLQTLGVLEFTGGERLFSIDGQHRIEGIKQALATDPEGFAEDELPVIIVAHSDTLLGKVRTRRLFSEINTKALRVSGLDDLITNEDNPIDINARRIYAEFEPFEKDKFILLSPKSSISANAEEFTTILNLRAVNKILYASVYKFRETRPNDDVIEDLYQKTLAFWTEAVGNLVPYARVLKEKTEIVANYRSPDGGSLLFRPIGIDLLAEVYDSWINEIGDTSGLWVAINLLDFDLNSDFWKGIIWDNAKKTILKISAKFLKEYTKYLLNLTYDVDYTKVEYSKLKGIEAGESVVLLDLPTRPS